MELKELLSTAHHLIEAKEKKRITLAQMAQRIGVGHRTYIEYQRGTNAPLAMKALLNLLNMLDDQEIVKVVHEWRNAAGETKSVTEQQQ
ncbi:MAG: XRE family transcriptional regulator [Candidimonas sp.]|nr:MAG: XRE family transcriptional regulator [Candidimonas sp.]TAM21273.1 MAG: XRE family transcriptional regulator [Candidimonas sp.]